MAFLLVNWAEANVGFNVGATSTTTPAEGAPNLFTYQSYTDNIATIGGANYFANDGVLFGVQVGDIIFANGTDSSSMLIVSAVNPTLGTISTSSFSVAGSVGTANIQNGAITDAKINPSAAIDFSKLATLTSGNVLVGNASNVATSVALSGDATISNTGVLTLASSAINSAKLSPAVLQYTFVAITASAFTGMYATPILLVNAPGANKLLVLDKVDLLMTYGSANYASGGVVAVQYDSTANGAGVIASTTLSAATFQAAASTGFMFNTGVVPQTFSTCVNKGLYLSNITGAFTTGDSVMVAHVWYKIINTI